MQGYINFSHTCRSVGKNNIIVKDKSTRSSLVHPNKDMFYTYVLRSLKDRKLYTGYSADLKSRFKAQNSGEVEATKHRKPFELIYYEAYQNQQDATAREKYLKTQWGRNYIKRTLKNYLRA